jgi:hypothetical protein
VIDHGDGEDATRVRPVCEILGCSAQVFQPPARHNSGVTSQQLVLPSLQLVLPSLQLACDGAGSAVRRTTPTKPAAQQPPSSSGSALRA